MVAGRKNGVWIPKDPMKRREPLVGPGVPVWSIVGYLKENGGDIAEVVRGYAGVLSEDDVRAAWDYYKRDPGWIDEKLLANQRIDGA
jgi:uncharacterized protein (DUF433 family)